MAKRPTPKKQQCKSSTSARYKSYVNKAQKKLMGMVENMKKQEKKGYLEKSSKKEVTTIKA